MIDPMRQLDRHACTPRTAELPALRHPRARRIRSGFLLTLLIVGITFVGCASAEDFPAWAFPHKSTVPGKAAADAQRSVPGSNVRLRDAQIRDLAAPPDWFPREHPAMPSPVGRPGTAGQWACAFCHLPGGEGRPENASLAGLPAAYIRAQVSAFQHDERRSAQPDWTPGAMMTSVAKVVSEAEIALAADYFSRLRFASHVRLIEGNTVPAHAASGYIYAPAAGPPIPIGSRIIEMPTDVERFERRDPHSRFVAYVPAGSVARGRKLALHGAAPCASCHGAGLRGGPGSVAPPLAGRSPTYLFRQLFGFSASTRTSAAAQPMRALAATLSEADMIALAAYAASLTP